MPFSGFANVQNLSLNPFWAASQPGLANLQECPFQDLPMYKTCLSTRFGLPLNLDWPISRNALFRICQCTKPVSQPVLGCLSTWIGQSPGMPFSGFANVQNLSLNPFWAAS